MRRRYSALPAIRCFDTLFRHIGLLFGERLDTLFMSSDSKISGFTRPHVVGFVADLFFPLWRADLFADSKISRYVWTRWTSDTLSDDIVRDRCRRSTSLLCTVVAFLVHSGVKKEKQTDNETGVNTETGSLRKLDLEVLTKACVIYNLMILLSYVISLATIS